MDYSLLNRYRETSIKADNWLRLCSVLRYPWFKELILIVITRPMSTQLRRSKRLPTKKICSCCSSSPAERTSSTSCPTGSTSVSTTTTAPSSRTTRLSLWRTSPGMDWNVLSFQLNYFTFPPGSSVSPWFTISPTPSWLVGSSTTMSPHTASPSQDTPVTSRRISGKSKSK